jgi:hypothetical protein
VHMAALVWLAGHDVSQDCSIGRCGKIFNTLCKISNTLSVQARVHATKGSLQTGPGASSHMIVQSPAENLNTARAGLGTPTTAPPFHKVLTLQYASSCSAQAV